MIQAFVGVWQEVASFLVSMFSDITTLFYADNSLTFIGIIAVVMSAISVFLLIWNLIRSFFSFRG